MELNLLQRMGYVTFNRLGRRAKQSQSAAGGHRRPSPRPGALRLPPVAGRACETKPICRPRAGAAVQTKPICPRWAGAGMARHGRRQASCAKRTQFPAGTIPHHFSIPSFQYSMPGLSRKTKPIGREFQVRSLKCQDRQGCGRNFTLPTSHFRLGRKPIAPNKANCAGARVQVPYRKGVRTSSSLSGARQSDLPRPGSLPWHCPLSLPSIPACLSAAWSYNADERGGLW